MRTRLGRTMAPRHLKPAFDLLDRRLVLSASPLAGLTTSSSFVGSPAQTASPGPYLTVTSTTPDGSSVLQTSPATLSITFDRPVDDFSLGNQDFDLVHVAADGTTTPLGPREPLLNEALDPTDPTGSRIVLSLVGRLAAGHYRLELDPSSQLQGLDGSSLAGESLGSSLVNFTLSPPQAGTAKATELGPLGPQVLSIPGSLDLANDPTAVQYDRFELAPGHHWLVGLEVSAHRDGSSLNSAVSLFNADGSLIATSSVGLASDPSDPYLFSGLAPGTYYVGVSSNLNQPASTGAYQLQRTSGLSAENGGSYHLGLVADVWDQPTSVLGLAVNHADPLSGIPTGLTLRFSAGLDSRALPAGGMPTVQLVDQAGQTFPLTTIAYDAGQGTLSVGFDRALPAGHYLVKLNDTAGLLDLAGRPPVATGLPVGTLGSFDLAPSGLATGDLGPIFVGPDGSTLNRSLVVSPGVSSQARFEVIQPGVYEVTGVDSGRGIGYAVEDQTGRTVATGSDLASVGANPIVLSAGTYLISLSTSSARSSVSFSIRLIQGEASSLLEGGVSQGPALALRLLTPPVAAVTTPATSSLDASAEPTSTSGAVRASTDAVGASTSPSPSSSRSPLGSTTGPSAPMIASPNSTPGVGPSVATGPSVAASFLGARLPGPTSSSSSNTGGGPGEEGLPGGRKANPVVIRSAGLPVPEETGDEPPTTLGAPRVGFTLDAGLLLQSAQSRSEDDRSLAQPDGLGLLLARTLDWLGGLGADGRVASEGKTDAPVEPMNQGLPAQSEESRLESASLTSPLGLGIVLGTVAYYWRKKFQRARADLSSKGMKSLKHPVISGPHRRRVEVKARQHEFLIMP